ncbi:MAG: TorD/DmsD family molecular chaperone [Campylobacter sp.]
MDKNITKARAYFYEFLAFPLFFNRDESKFQKWQQQLDYLAQNPISDEMANFFKTLKGFSFDKFCTEQNDVLFDFSYSNIPLNASFYEDGRDDGMARLRVIECLKQSSYYRDSVRCKDSEDYVGFILLLMATFLNDEINGSENISNKLFATVLNIFIDEFCSLLKKHINSDFFVAYAEILDTFMSIERAILAVEAPKKVQGESIAEAAMKKEPFHSKMPTAKTKIGWDEFSPVIKGGEA